MTVISFLSNSNHNTPAVTETNERMEGETVQEFKDRTEVAIKPLSKDDAGIQTVEAKIRYEVVEDIIVSYLYSIGALNDATEVVLFDVDLPVDEDGFVALDLGVIPSKHGV